MSTDEHRTHDWKRVEGGEGIRAWRCAECEATCATCGTCGRPSGTSLLLCRDCERHAERVLEDIEHALGHYLRPDRSLMRSPMAYTLTPPGSGKVLLATPADVDGAMWHWVARWTELVGDPSNIAAAEYLRTHHLWAAHHPEVSDWPEYLKAMRRLRHAARRMAGLLPQRLPEPCVHCGGDVVQDWADEHWDPLEDGLSDTVRCTQCGMTWGDRSRWRFTTRQHIVETPGAHPDALVTLEQARLIWPDVPAATWRQWLKRDRDAHQQSIDAAITWWQARCAHGTDDWDDWAEAGWTEAMLDVAPDIVERQVPERGERDGRALYRVRDLHARVVRWVDESRPGRRARSSERMSA